MLQMCCQHFHLLNWKNNVIILQRMLKQTQSDIKLEIEESPEVNDQVFNEDVLKQESE